ncbi:MAG: hypothetical protein CME36_07965 [unclassified Hahellaceae]|nr:hypothetical protein [Hahellaceae bacterium]
MVSRIYFKDGEFPVKWNSFRYFGPTDSRFDHHVMRAGEPCVQDRGIMYLATGQLQMVTAVAEVYQARRYIDRNHAKPCYVAFNTARTLRLLDLTGNFVTKVGASTAIHSGPRRTARAWSAAFYDIYPDIDGLMYCSSMNGNAPAIALYERGRDALPARHLKHYPLAAKALDDVMYGIALDLGYRIS